MPFLFRIQRQQHSIKISLLPCKKIPKARVISIEQIKNQDIESSYENMKRTIARECPNDDPTTYRRVIFYNKVLLGIESKQSTTYETLTTAPTNSHSVHGIGGWQGFQYHEYIVYRYGQALPYLRIPIQHKQKCVILFLQ